MKKIILIAGLLASCSTGLFAQVLVSRGLGDLTTIAGWDFNQGTATTVTSVNARYNQSYNPYFTAGTVTSPGSALYGTAYFSGSNGATFASARSLNSSNAPSYDLLSTVGLGVNNSLGDQASNARSLLLGGAAALDNGRATFKISTANSFNNFEDLNVAYSARNQAASGFGTIDWSYSLDGINFTSIAGTSSQIDPSGTNYSVFTADFSAITAIEGQSAVWLGLNYTESAAAVSVLFDNLAIYGTAVAAIPEPSTYAAIMGALVIGVAAIRRRRSQVLA